MNNLSASLPSDVWQTLYAMMLGQRPPLAIERQAIQAFEAAMQAAQQPPAPQSGISDG